MFSRGLYVFVLILGLTVQQTTSIAGILDFCDQNNILDLLNGITEGLLGINILPATGLLAGIVQLLLGRTITVVGCVTQLGSVNGLLAGGVLGGLTGKLAIGCISQDVEKAQQLCEADVLKKIINEQGCVSGGLSILKAPGGGLLSGVLGGGLLGGLLGGGGLPLVGDLLGGGLLGGLGGLLGSNGCVKNKIDIDRAKCLLAAGQENCKEIAKLSAANGCDLCKLLTIVAQAPKIADCACQKIDKYGAGGDLLGLLGGSNPLCIVENLHISVIEGLLESLLGIVLQLLGGIQVIPILGQCPA